jgi:hypothetical protein
MKSIAPSLFAEAVAVLIAGAAPSLFQTTAHATTVTCFDPIFATFSGHCDSDPRVQQTSTTIGPGPEFTVSGLGAVIPFFNGMNDLANPNPILIDVTLNSVILSLRDPIPPPDPVIGNVSWLVIDPTILQFFYPPEYPATITGLTVHENAPFSILPNGNSDVSHSGGGLTINLGPPDLSLIGARFGEMAPSSQTQASP